MSTIDTGGPAFPMQEPKAIHAYALAATDGITDLDERDRAYLKARGEVVCGVTLRDYFAAKAMQGFLAGYGAWTDEDFSGEAAGAYRVADAMLAARKAGTQP